MQTKTSLYDQLHEQGYTVAEQVLDAEALRAIKVDYHHLLDRKATEFYNEGIISSEFKDLPFEERLTSILLDAKGHVYSHFDIALPNNNIQPNNPIHVSRAVFDLLRNERLLDAVEEIIGGEIMSSPIQHVRMKPPQRLIENNQGSLVRQTGWHQDMGVARPEADESEIVTVWIAITDATVENGCLQVIPYSHLEGITLHCPIGEMKIPDTLLGGEPTPVPIKAGDAILMHRLTKHASLPNISDSVRWSFDLRYQPIGVPTGRDEFPSLIVRSRKNPAQVQTDYEAWAQSWYDTRDRLCGQTNRPKTHRWDGDDPACA